MEQVVCQAQCKEGSEVDPWHYALQLAEAIVVVFHAADEKSEGGSTAAMSKTPMIGGKPPCRGRKRPCLVEITIDLAEKSR
jgi:hypothetical protein